MSDTAPPRVEWLGESAVLLHFGERIDSDITARVHAAAARLRAASLDAIIEAVPAYASLLLRFDPLAPSPSDCLDAALRWLSNAATQSTAPIETVRDIPVCYDTAFAPDLDELALRASLPRDEVIARHTAADYRVAMLGFAPGFPYLIGLDLALHTPRRATPRTRVPAGSVAIGGAQTGIYPRELPGGWHLIGRTPLRLFDIERTSPALLAAGDRVRFRAIDPEEFRHLVRDSRTVVA